MTIDAPAADLPVPDAHEEQLVVQRGASTARRLRYENLTGQQKVAIVLAQLRPETSSTLLKAVGEQEAVLLATELANLPPLDREVVGKVLEEFVGKVNTTRSIGQGGLAQARQMLAAAVGEERAAQLVPHLRGNVAAGSLASLSQANPEVVVPLLVDEHPQTVAVILAHMSPNDGSRLLDHMPNDFRCRGRGPDRDHGPCSPGGRQHGCRATGGQAPRPRCRRLVRTGWRAGVGRVAQRVGRLDGKAGARKLEERSPELAEAVRAHMFTFEDVLAMEDRTLQLVLRGIKISDLALAIKGASEDPGVMDKIKRNLSDRAQAELVEELEVMGQVRVSQVDQAQSTIIREVRELEAKGEIVIARQTDQLV